MSRHPHIVGRQFVDIGIAPEEDAFAVQHEISRLFQEQAASALEELFSRYADDETFIRIDRLEVDIGDLDSTHLADELKSKLTAAVDKALTSHLAASPHGDMDSGSSRTAELWQFYLREGHFPWWASPPSQSELEERILRVLGDPVLTERVRALLASSYPARRRLAMQFTDQFLQQLVDDFAPGVGTSLDDIRRAFPRIASEAPMWQGRERMFRDALWLEALEEVFARKPPMRLAEIVRCGVHRVATGDPAESAAPERHYGRSAPSSSDWLLRRLLDEVGLPSGGVDEPEAPASEALREQGASSPESPGDGPSQGRLEDAEETAETSDASQRDSSEKPGENSDESGADDENDSIQTSRKQHPPISSPDDSARSEVGARSAEDSHRNVSENDPREAQSRNRRSDRAERRSKAQNPVWWKSTELPDASGDGIDADEADVYDHGDPADAISADERVIYVANAGLVLLHPFLAAHFERLGLTKEAAFIDDDARQLAVHQLQYLATRETSVPEYVMVLNKMLCGLRPGDTIAREVMLDEAFNDEGERLLESVIEHWKSLKNTSPDGLREAFLQRDGKLTPSMDGWKLVVERKSYDILLNRLPWGLGIVKLPWMPQLLHVQWS